MLTKLFTKFLYILLSVVILSSINIYSQVKLDWVARYNGPSNFSEYVSAMALDSSGNVYVTGRDSEEPYGFVTIKFNSSGQIVWARRFTDELFPGSRAIDVDGQGNVYIGGNTNTDYLIVKYDSNGVLQWYKTYRGSGPRRHQLVDMVLDNAGNISVVVTGSSDNLSTGRDIGTLKYNTYGDTLWVRNYSRLNNTLEFATGMDLDIFGVITVSGNTKLSLQPQHILTLSYDVNGNLRWAQTWNGPGNRWDEARDIAVDKNGNVYVTGNAIMDTLNSQNITTIKYDSNGNQQWVRFYDGSGNYFIAYGRFIKTDPFGNVVVAGWQAIHDYDYCTIKYDSLGNQLWVQGYNGAANREDFLKGLAVDNYGNVYVTGTTKDIDVYPYPYKITTIKYDKDGNQVWLQKYPDGDTISSPAAIIVDKDLNVYIAGSISVYTPYGASKDIIVLKYSQQPTSVEPISREVPEGFALYQNYPNPFNGITNIKYQISKTSFVKIKVYDIFGRVVAVLVNEKKEAGEHHVEWNPSTSLGQVLPSGVYYYRIISGTYCETKKALLIR